MVNLFDKHDIVRVCPYCGVKSQHKYLNLIYGTYELLDNSPPISESFDSSVYLLSNFHAIQCQSCEAYSIFNDKEMIYPLNSDVPVPCEDMPNNIIEIYNEAKKVLVISPKSACALLRLALENLMDYLKVDGKNLKEKICKYCDEYHVDESLKKSFHILRIVGNEAVHPGTINIDDNEDIARSLFGILNYIVDETITRKNKIDKIFDDLPKNKTKDI